MSDPVYARTPARSLAWPLLIGLAALFLSFAFQTYQLVRERSNLATALTEQASPLLEGDRLRNQLEGLLGGANDLAQKGDQTAAAVLATLAKQGITYKPPVAPTP